MSGRRRGRCGAFLSHLFFAPIPRYEGEPAHAMHCRRGERVTMHSPGRTATKARGQNTGHDRVARCQCCHTCYLDDRVHGEQRQRTRSSLLRRHRWCHCRRDIPGIWRFGLLRCGAQTHEKKVGQQQIAVAAEGRCSFVEQIIRRRRRRHRREIFALSLLRDLIIEVSGVHTAQHMRGIKDCSLDASLRQRPIWPAR